MIAPIDNHTTPRALTAAEPVVEFDPLRDTSYRKTPIGRDIVSWLDWLKGSNKADRTVDSYERTVATLAKMYPRRDLASLDEDDLMRLIASWPSKSRRHQKSQLNSFFKWARVRRRITANPLELLPDIKRTPQRYIDIFSDAEIQDLYDLPSPNGFLMRLLFETGIRRKEAVTLQVRRLKLEPPAHVVIVGGKGDKDRVIVMSRVLRIAALEFLLLENLDPKDHLWHTRPGGGSIIKRDTPMGDASWQRWWKTALDNAGVRYRNPHVARHTFATKWLRDGGTLSTLKLELGHTSIKTTEDLYSHLDMRDVLADLRRIEQIRSEKAPN